MPKVEIREYTRRELRALLGDLRFWSQPKLPITQRRVRSHIANPNAEDSDTVLITASSDGETIAHIGMLPDLMRIPGEMPVKIAWLTGWWADKHKGGTAAAMLLFAAMRKYANRVAVSSFSDDAKRMFDGTKRFQNLTRFDLTYFVLALPPSWHLVGRISRFVVGAKNRLICTLGKRATGIETRTIDRIDEPVDAFITRHTDGDPLARSKMQWNWILDFPWVSASADDKMVQKRYEFSVFSEDFRQVPIVVKRHDAIIGFLFLTLHAGRLWLKYAYYDPADAEDVSRSLRAVIANINPWLFVCADKRLASALEHGMPFWVALRNKTLLAYAAKVLPAVNGLQPQFGIGDTVFT